MKHLVVSILVVLSVFHAFMAVAEDCKSNGERVIALGGTVTEIIYALEQGDRLVGVDTTSNYPVDAARKPKLGYYRAVASEGILSLAPDLVIADADAGPDKILEQVSAAGVCVVRTPDGGTLASVTARVNKIAEILEVSEKGNVLAQEIQSSSEQILADVAKQKQNPRVLFLLSVSAGTPVAAGAGTEADAIIALAGGINAGEGIEGYKPLTPEAAIAAKPDYILMMNHVIGQSGGPQSVLSIPQVALTPAGKAGNLIGMDGLLLLGFGPRTPEAIQQLAQKIHLDLTLASVDK